jgi:glycosyltransferase involved in cell wall biosynthesis
MISRNVMHVVAQGRDVVDASIIIPARNEAASIGCVVEAVLAQQTPDRCIEVIVADDGSTDDTRARAEAAGALVIELPAGEEPGNPAALRNRAAQAARGRILIFLDADCMPAPGWLSAILIAHVRGEAIVGGALDLPPGLSTSARCDYYCGWYLVHSRRTAGYVAHHPPPNLSVRRDVFLATSGFTERQPFSYTNEERHWLAEARKAGHLIWFEPRAVAYHANRTGFRNLFRRNYRWAYTAIEAKSQTGVARHAWLYRHPKLIIAGSLPLAFAHTAYIIACWVRAGIFEPLLMSPAILASRFAYAAGMAVGGVRWLRSRSSNTLKPGPLWK